MPFGIFRLRTLTGANLVGLLVGAALFAMFFFLSRYMQEVLGYSALDAGLSYLPLALAIIFSAGAASVLVTKFGFKPVLLAGLGLVTIGLLWFAQVPEDGVYLAEPPRADGHLRGRAGLRVRAGHDRRGLGRVGGRIGARLRPHQHVAADRRRAGPRRPGHDRRLEDDGPAGSRSRARRRRSPAR